MRTGRGLGARREAGFTYIGLLALIVLIGILLAAAGEVASTSAQRERETELIFIGHQYRDAIGRYLNLNHRYPQTLQELVQEENAGPVPAHYLRRLYVDPMTRSADWVLVPAPDGGIMGVASVSAKTPIKTGGFDDLDDFKDAKTYADWTFAFDPVVARRQRLLRAQGGLSPN